MVISSKTEEQSLPITPAAPAPCTHRMSNPLPPQARAGREGGQGAGALHLPGGATPQLCRSSFSRQSPRIPLPTAPHPRVVCPSTGWASDAAATRLLPGLGRDSASAGPQHSALWGFPTNPGTRSAAGASFPSGTHFGSWDGGRKGVDPARVGGSLPSGLPPKPFTHTYAW